MARTNESPTRQQAVLTAMRKQGATCIALRPVLGSDAAAIDTVNSWRISLYGKHGLKALWLDAANMSTIT